MISFRLRCPEGHEFEGWFRSSSDFESQNDRGLIACPNCGSEQVEKAIMAPAVARSTQKTQNNPPAAAPEVLPPEKAPATAAKTPRPVQVTPEMAAKMMAVMRKVKAHVEENFENVGKQFPEEVRKMHYGETEERNIYGEAGIEDVKDLIEEGIDVMPLPDVPDLDS